MGRRRRIVARVGAVVRRAARKWDCAASVLLESGRVVALDGVLLPGVDASGVSVGAVGVCGVWVFPLDDWLALGDVGTSFSISGAGSVWSPDVVASPVVVLPEQGVVRVSCIRVVAKRN